MTSDDRDFRNIKQFLSRAKGKKEYSPVIVNTSASWCDCWFDRNSQAYCYCSPMSTSEMIFGQSRINRGSVPGIHVATPIERSIVKRLQMKIAQSIA
jgi:hypothetical protein